MWYLQNPNPEGDKVNDSALILQNDERVELIEALQSAVAILSLEFSENEGSGNDTPSKCRQALGYLWPGTLHFTAGAGI